MKFKNIGIMLAYFAMSAATTQRKFQQEVMSGRWRVTPKDHRTSGSCYQPHDGKQKALREMIGGWSRTRNKYGYFAKINKVLTTVGKPRELSCIGLTNRELLRYVD